MLGILACAYFKTNKLRALCLRFKNCVAGKIAKPAPYYLYLCFFVTDLAYFF